MFAHWLIQSRNSPFARNAVNRVWYWLLGRGIIHEPDDSRADNPPCNPELLAWLAQELVSANYDLKQICRMILNSQTYQLSCIPPPNQPVGEVYFASYPVRRLDAEVLIDAINQITGSTEEYSSMIPEPFTWVPVDHRSIALPDGSISSAFLDLFGPTAARHGIAFRNATTAFRMPSGFTFSTPVTSSRRSRRARNCGRFSALAAIHATWRINST